MNVTYSPFTALSTAYVDQQLRRPSSRSDYDFCASWEMETGSEYDFELNSFGSNTDFVAGYNFHN